MIRQKTEQNACHVGASGSGDGRGHGAFMRYASQPRHRQVRFTLRTALGRELALSRELLEAERRRADRLDTLLTEER